MINFLLLMVIPVLVALATLIIFNNRVTWFEFLGQVAIVGVLVASGIGISYHNRVADTEIWNSKITQRASEHVSCSHSYSCNCTTDSKGHRSCSTCYEHAYDVDWFVSTSSGEKSVINRIDRQGLDMPPRWAKAFIGEPFASEHSYTNYIKVNPDSVLLGGRGDIVRFSKFIPEYPTVSDYYRTNHVFTRGLQLDLKPWEWLIQETNKELGPVKQVNIILILAGTNDPKMVLALKDAWLGGKKNDVVVVIGSADGHVIDFVDVLSWCPKASFKIKLRDAIQDIGTLDKRDEIVYAIKSGVGTDFTRMHMKDFAYMTRSFQPSREAMYWLLALGVISSLGLAVWSVINDINPNEGMRTWER